MLRRELIVLGTGFLAVASLPVAAQEMAVTTDQIRPVYENDDSFERMLLSLFALRAALALSKSGQDSNALNAFYKSEAMYASGLSEARGERKNVLSTLEQDPTPVILGARLEKAVGGVGQQLRESGLAEGSPLYEAFLGSLKIYLAAQIKVGRSVEDWFCNTFPFSEFC